MLCDFDKLLQHVTSVGETTTDKMTPLSSAVALGTGTNTGSDG